MSAPTVAPHVAVLAPRTAPPSRAAGPALRLLAPVGLALVVALYLVALLPWMLGWGTTAAERSRALPGDELTPAANHQSTRAVTVRAPADAVWPWLVQIGEDRAGFYSYSWLENLFGANIRNASAVRPDWQTLRAGDLVRAVPDGYLGGILPESGWRVAAIEPGRWFVLRGWGVFLVEPVDAGTSRVIVRTRFRDDTWWGPVVTALAFEPVHFTMERRMLLGIRDRAEARQPSTLLHGAAALGFAAGAGAVVALAWRRRRAVWRLAAPGALAAAVLWGTGDVLAAAAGFVALGAVVVALPFVRRWWPALLPAPAAVLLLVLLAPDAFVAIGLSLLAAVAVGTAAGALA